MTDESGYADKLGFIDKYIVALRDEINNKGTCLCYNPNIIHDCKMIKGCKVKDINLLVSVISALLKVKCKHKFYNEILRCISYRYSNIELFSLCSEEDKREILKLNTCWNEYMMIYITSDNKYLYKDSIINYYINNTKSFLINNKIIIGNIMMLYEYNELGRLINNKNINDIIYEDKYFTPIMIIKKYPNINKDNIDHHLFSHRLFDVCNNKLEYIEYILENNDSAVLIEALMCTDFIGDIDIIELIKKFIIRTNNINDEVFSTVFYYDYVELVEFLYSYRVFDTITFTKSGNRAQKLNTKHKSSLLLDKMGYNYTKNNFMEIIKNHIVVDKKLLEKYNLHNDGDILVSIAKLYRFYMGFKIIDGFVEEKEKKLIMILSKKSKNTNVFVKEYEKKIYENHVPTRMLMLCALINNLHDEIIPILVKKGGEILPEYMALYEPILWKYIDSSYKFEKK